MDDEQRALLRKGVRRLILQTFRRMSPPPALDNYNWKDLAGRIEEACNRKAYAEDGGESPRALYARTFNGVCAALPQPYGDLLENHLGVMIALKKVSVDEAINEDVYTAHLAITPRQRGCAAVHRKLKQHGGIPPRLCVDYAHRIERSVYNIVIRHCQHSEESYTRLWTSPMFLNIYSARLGSILANLDPNGIVAKNFRDRPGSWLLNKLASGTLSPDAVGGMSSTELCPDASKEERRLISIRLEQKVTEKTSSLFKCPKCGARNHTYRQVQIGAGDEPSTFMCTCQECGQNYEGSC